IDRRVMAYLEGGAREVIAVGQRGQVDYWGVSGRPKASMFDVTVPLDPCTSKLLEQCAYALAVGRGDVSARATDWPSAWCGLPVGVCQCSLGLIVGSLSITSR